MSTPVKIRTWPVALAAGLVAFAVLAANAASALAAAPRCTSGALITWLESPGSGAAGSIYYHLELTNVSARACTLAGYPGVSGVDVHGGRLGAPAARDSAISPRVVRLASGASATVILRITDVYNFPSAACRRVLAAGLRVYAPGQTISELVPYPFEACARSGAVYLFVQAVQPGLPPIH